MHKTFVMLKPDAVERRLIGRILSEIEAAGLAVRAMKMRPLSREEGEFLYAEHADKGHFSALVDFTCSGPCVLLAIEGDNAISRMRELIGPSDLGKAGVDTIRRRFAESTRRNCVHSSDGAVAASRELSFFFPGMVINEP